MRSLATVACVLSLAGITLIEKPASSVASPQTQPHPSTEATYLTPGEIKLSPDGRTLYAACEGNDTAIAVDLRTRKVVAQVPVGHKPRGLTLSPDGRTLYVSNSWSDSVTEIGTATFKVRRTLKTGWGPVGLTTDRNGKYLYVADSIGDDVMLIDLATGKEVKRFHSARYPEQVLLSRDGRRVYVSNLLPLLGPFTRQPDSVVLAIDAVHQLVAETILVPDTIELRKIAEAPASLGSYLLVPLMQPKNLGPLIEVEQGWMMTHGAAIIKPDLRPGVDIDHSRVTQVVLDDLDHCFAGGYGVAFTPSGRYALITEAEAKTVSVIDTAKFAARLREVPSAELALRLDSAQSFLVKRLPMGNDPRSIAVSPDGRYAYVANRLDDKIGVINLTSLKNEPPIDLGGPKVLSALRHGEQLFSDAKYCYEGQFACLTCHPNSHLDGLAWNIETPKLGRDRVANRTLRGIKDTAPYKWSGKNPDLATQCGPRIAKYFFRSEGFNTRDLEDLITYLNNIPLPPNRHLAPDGQLTDAQELGRRVYYRTHMADGKPIPVENQCATCHPASSHYTNKLSENVGSADKYDTSGLFDTPQLDGVYEDAPYLHNGEALTLEEIWTIYNNQDTHGVTSDLSKEQLNDLIEYLKTL
jgi:YVTN family beta-propeller protein